MTPQRDKPFERYLELLDVYGADFERWPVEERAAAEQLVLESEEARSARREAEGLDELLDQAPAVDPSDILKARVHDIPNRVRPAGTRQRSGWLRRLGPTLALAAAALLGVAAGNLTYDSPGERVSVDPAEMTSEDWEELTELAFATHLDSEDWP